MGGDTCTVVVCVVVRVCGGVCGGACVWCVCVVALPLREMVSRRRRTEEENGGGERRMRMASDCSLYCCTAAVLLYLLLYLLREVQGMCSPSNHHPVYVLSLSHTLYIHTVRIHTHTHTHTHTLITHTYVRTGMWSGSRVSPPRTVTWPVSSPYPRRPRR